MILVLTAGAFVRTLGFGFVYDDQLQIVNSVSAHSWRFFPQYFTMHVWKYAQPANSPTYYRPIFLVWLLINYTLFGLEPLWWHLTTILAHLTATLMLYLLARRLTGERTVAIVASLVFGLHPIHVEAVAWVSGVTEPLLAVFIVSSFLCYTNWRRQNGKQWLSGWFAGSLVLYALALLEKETAVAFPTIILAYEWMYLSPEGHGSVIRRLQRVQRALKAAAPYLVLAVSYLAIRSVVLGGFRVLTIPLQWSTMILTEPSVLFRYIRLLVWPVGLSPFYDLPYTTQPSFSSFILPTMIVIFAALALYFWSRRSRSVAFASVWIVALLLPVLNLRAFGPEELVHDRYLYLPSMGFAILVGLAFGKLRVSPAKIGGQPLELVLSAAAFTCLLIFGIVKQSGYWENNLLLFRHAVSAAPENSLAKHSLAIELGTLGMYNEAIPLLQRVLEIRPRSFEANAALGRYYFATGAYLQAGLYLSRALELRPNLSRTLYAYLALSRAELGDLDSAEDTIRQGLKIVPLDPDNRMIHSALGEVLKRRGDLRGALAQFKLANTPVHEGY